MPIFTKKTLAFLTMATLASALVFTLISLSLYKNFSIDEFTYAHAGWLISKGNLPYRDYFSHHFPLSYFVLSIPFLFFGDNPSNIIYLRFLMWPFISISFLSACFINRIYTQGLYWFTGIILLSIPTFTIFATEIRPDTMALASFSLALSICFIGGKNLVVQGLTIGFLVAISILFSEKVILYGSIVMIGFLIDCIYNSKKNKGFMVGQPKHVALGALSIFSVFLIFLFKTNSFEAWIKHSLQFTFDYQNFYQGFSWQKFFWPSMIEILILLPLTLLGAFQSFFKWLYSGKRRWRDPEMLILLGLVTTLFSYIFQKQPFPYSLMPFCLFTAIYTLRGIILIFNKIYKIKTRIRPRIRVFSIIVVCFSCLFYSIHIYTTFDNRLNNDNHHQLEIMQWINTNTLVSDSIYDNSGSYISRQHASFYYFTNSFIRQYWIDFLNTNIPYSIEKTGSTIFINDSRFNSLPAKLKSYIRTNFYPLDNNFWIWGKRFWKDEFKEGVNHFNAIRTGRYFIFPRQVPKEGNFLIDGERIQDQVFLLNRGFHKIEYAGMADGFYLIWLPRNEKPFSPIESTAGTFVPTF